MLVVLLTPVLELERKPALNIADKTPIMITVAMTPIIIFLFNNQIGVFFNINIPVKMNGNNSIFFRRIIYLHSN